jgi:uncharacterized protein YkuJ
MKKSTVFISILLLVASMLILSACRSGEDIPSDPTIIPTEEQISFSVSLNSATKTLVQGDSFILVATLDGITEYDSIGWAADGNLLQILPNGLNAVITAGTATGVETITVTVIKGDVQETATSVITVDPITLSISVDSDDITLNQGESAVVAVTVDPLKTETVVSWTEDGSLLDINVSGNNATLTAGGNVGTTTVVVAASIFGQTFEKEITVTINEIVPFVDATQSMTDVTVGETVDIDLDFVTAYLEDKSFSVSFDDDTFASAEVIEGDILRVTGLSEGQAVLTLTMTTDGVEYTDTVNVYVRPAGYVGVAANVYDQFDLQLNFTESTFFSSIDEEIWQAYNILLGAAANSGQGDLRGQFIFAINHQFAKDGDKDVIQVMANGMSAMAIKIPDAVDNLGAIEFSMKLADLGESFDATWRLEFYIATVLDGNMTLYGRANAENNALLLGNLIIPTEDLIRDGYHTYRFNVDTIPENAGNYIVIYFGNTTRFNGTEEDRTYIESFNFLSKELTGIALTTEPSQLEYVVGQSFDPTDMVISSVYTVGNDMPIAYEDLTVEYDFSTVGTKVVTVTYQTYSVTFNVEVIEKMISTLDLTALPSKVIYTAGELFDPTDMVVTAVYNDGSSEVVTTYTYDMSPLVLGQQSIDVAFNSLSVTVSITVNSAALSSIEVTTQPIKVEYVVGQEVDYSGIVVTAHFADASTEVISFNDLAFSGFDSAAPVTGQVITVTYGGQETTFTVDIIEKVVSDVAITQFPRVVYFIGETATWSGLEVVVVYNDDSTEAVSFEDLVISGFDSSVVGSFDITVAYLTYEAEFSITITDQEGYTETTTVGMDFDTTDLVNLNTMYHEFFSGETPANSADYDVLLGRTLNDAQRLLQYSEVIYFSGEGAEAVIVVQTNGMSAMAVRIPDGLTAADIQAFSFSMSGEHITTLADTVTFRPSFRFSSVFDGVEYFHTTDRGDYYLNQSAGITITQPDFTRAGFHDYTVMIDTPALAEGVTLGNYLLIYMGNNGSFRDSTNTSLHFNGFKFWTRDAIVDIALINEPSQLTYEVDEVFNPAGLVVTPLYGIDVYSPMAQINTNNLTFDYDFSTLGETTVTVTYGSHSVQFQVTVIEVSMIALEVTNLPDKVAYTTGELFDPTGMVISALFDNNTSAIITEYTYDMSPLVSGATSIQILYEGLIVEVPITVEDPDVESISLTTQPTKVEYVVGQEADYSGIVVTGTYSDTSTVAIPFEDLVFSGFDSSAPVTGQVITVTYGELTTTFTIDVVAKEALGIKIQVYPLVTFMVGAEVDWSGLEVVVVYNDDSTEAVSFEDLVISGFDSSVVGSFDITVAYLTYEAEFSITITDQEGYTETTTVGMDFDTTDLVNLNTMYHEFFSGETPANSADYDVLLGRTLNDAQRLLQYSEVIYFSGEGAEAVIVVQTNGMSAMAVRIPDGLTAADIQAFSFSMSGEHITTLADTVTFRPSFRFSSVFDGVEYFHTTDRGDYYLNQSAGITITQPDFTRAGFHDYTVMIDTPALAEGVTLGNYLLIYMGNNGSFRDSTNTSLHFNGFKFWTRDAIVDIALINEPSQLTYEVDEVFNPAGLVVTPLYGIDVYSPMAQINTNNLTFDYDFSTLGETTVTVTYGSHSVQFQVTVIEATLPEDPIE